MQYRRLGSSGLQLSALSFGAWVTFAHQLGRGGARELIAAAWDAGINFFDNAEAYANGEAERVMGDAIADLRLPRDGFCVSSKVFFGAADEVRPTQRGLSRKHVHDACHDALRRLRVDYSPEEEARSLPQPPRPGRTLRPPPAEEPSCNTVASDRPACSCPRCRSAPGSPSATSWAAAARAS